MKFSWGWAIAFIGIGAALTLSAGITTAALAGCAVWAFLGPVHALRALALSALIAYANPALVMFGAESGALFRLVLLLAAISVLRRIRLQDIRIVWPVWLFSLVAALTSAIASPAVTISLMKVLTFMVGVTTVLVACNKLRPHELARLETWFITLAVCVVALSALVLLNPKAAFLRNGRGFQGVLSHPQSFGTVLAPFAAWLVAGLMLMRGRLAPIQTLAAGVFLAMMFATQARTAAVASILGIAGAMLTRLFMQRQPAQAKIGKMLAVASAGAVAIGIVGLATGKVSEVVTTFVMKRGTAEGVSEAFYESRGSGALAQWHHFLDRPLTGNGFGVYPDGRFPSGVTEFAGIPISAPVEKGFVPTAVLEETGLLGGLCFVLLLAALSHLAWRNSDLRWVAMFIACLSVNLGEAVILSPGGIGIVVWLLIGLAIAPARNLKRRSVVIEPSLTQQPAVQRSALA